MLDNRRWFGEFAMPLPGSTPRHRSIARFAIEKCIRAIVCLNWDALLETALERVGLPENANLERPWDITSYARVAEDSHMRLLHSSSVLPLIKPHGCVRELEKARNSLRATGITPPFTLKITKTNLCDNTNQMLLDRAVEGYVAMCPLLVIGWKAAIEANLRNMIINTSKVARHTEADAFTLINRSWYIQHSDIAGAYGRDKASSFVEVAKPNTPTIDELFLWLQARFALTKMIVVNHAEHQVHLSGILSQLDEPHGNDPLLQWVDCWLHTWVRLCWRAGVMQGFDPRTNRRIEPSDIPLLPRDLHIPLSGMSLDRRELRAAARLLFELGDALARFDYRMFQGGLWDSDENALYIPLPGWQGADAPSYLTALPPFIEAMLPHWGIVDKLFLVWLDSEDVSPNEAQQQQIAAQIGTLLPSMRFVNPDSNALYWVDLQSLRGGTDAAMA